MKILIPSNSMGLKTNQELMPLLWLFEFVSWLSPEFKLYLIKEFERLKYNEAYQQKIEWSATRLLSKVIVPINKNVILIECSQMNK